MSDINYKLTQPDGDNKSDIKEIGDNIRSQMLDRNNYKPGFIYSVDATVSGDLVSDGDTKGRGDNGNPSDIGTSIDVTARNEQLALNQFTKANMYKSPED